MDEQNASNPYDGTDAPIRRRFPAFLKGTAIVLTILLLFMIVLRFLTPGIYYRFYFGDRIKGTVTVMIDGEPAVILKDSLSDSQTRAEGNVLHISARANAYGSYPFSFSVEELPDITFHFYSFQFNWWNVTRFDLRYNVNTEERIVEYRAEHTELEESGRKSAPIIWEGSYPLEEHWTEVSVCSP